MRLPILANTTQVDDALHASSLIKYVPSTCHDLNHCRTITNIVWSCFATIFVCIWVGVHTNMPKPQVGVQSWRDWGHNILERVGVSVLELLAPEFILVWAVRQWFAARSIARKFQDAHDGKKPTSEPEPEPISEPTKSMWKRVWLNFMAYFSWKSTKPDKITWTTTHGFFVIMGGFHLFDDDGKPLHPLGPRDVLMRIKKRRTRTYNSFKPPSEYEIKDRSKGDAVSKTIILGQTVWFVAQCAARWNQGIAVTELEIVTLAYTLIIILIYIAWWNKPLSVGQPVRVWVEGAPTATIHSSIPGSSSVQSQKKKLKIWQDIFTGKHDADVIMSCEEKVPVFYAGKPDDRELALADLIASVIAILFGAVHCAAWSFLFPSRTEQLLWRIASAVVAGGPGIWMVYFSLTVGMGWERETEREKERKRERQREEERERQRELRLERERERKQKFEQEKREREEQKQKQRKRKMEERKRKTEERRTGKGKKGKKNRETDEEMETEEMETEMEERKVKEMEKKKERAKERAERMEEEEDRERTEGREEEEKEEMHEKMENEEKREKGLWLLRYLSLIVIPVYIAARVVLLTIAFMTLRLLPQTAYQTVTWTTFVLHL